MGFDLSKQKT